MKTIEPITTEAYGIRLMLLEGYRNLFRILSRQPIGGRWDLIAVDKYMITEILSQGKIIKVGIIAEVSIDFIPPELENNQEVEIEHNGEKLIIKSYTEYEALSNMVYYAIVTKINKFRAMLRNILIKYRKT